MSENDLKIDRRSFLAGTAGLLAAAASFPVHAQNDRATIDVLLNEGQGTIAPDNFGYLLEVIGTSIYDGVWVGEKSKIPNIGGIRKDLIEHLRKINASVIRWPGGCFASNYDWKDGIGPQSQRPTRTSFWNDKFPKDVPNGPHRFDPNQFGTHEYMHLCKLTGGRPMLNANTRGLPPQEFDRWFEYCNAPAGTTTLANLRAKNGSKEPFDIKYWGIGNEPWGYDGALTAEEYLTQYRNFASMVPEYSFKPQLMICGGSLDWVNKMMAGTKNKTWPDIRPQLMSLHHYPSYKRDALKFDDQDFYEYLAGSAYLENLIERTWEVMAISDPEHYTKIAVDEWGAILEKGTELSSTNYWSRAVTLRDTLSAALSLDLLNRHSDKVTMACFTGLMNQEGGIFLTEGSKFVATGIYHVFEMYAPHQGAQLIPIHINAPSITHNYKGPRPNAFLQNNRLAGLNGSASLKSKTLTLTVVNPHVTEARETRVDLGDARVNSARMTVLRHDDIHAQNTFDEPNILRSVEMPVRAQGSSFVCHFPSTSVSRLTIELGQTDDRIGIS
jgi:alpha-L-arabinofuranosidase